MRFGRSTPRIVAYSWAWRRRHRAALTDARHRRSELQALADVIDVEVHRTPQLVPWLVTSVVSPASTMLSYTKTRSIFSASERQAQTVETVKSIARVAGTTSLVVDAGLRDTRIEEALEGCRASLVQIPRPSLIATAIDGPFKGLGEALLLIAFSMADVSRDGFWKISGRYALLDGPGVGACPALTPASVRAHRDDGVLSTVCIGIGAGLVQPFARALEDSIEEMLTGMSLEEVFTRFVALGAHAQQNLPFGVEGRIAVDGSLVRL